jgi:hypothetical protein
MVATQHLTMLPGLGALLLGPAYQNTEITNVENKSNPKQSFVQTIFRLLFVSNPFDL